MSAAAAPTGIKEYIPILGWLPNYQSRWLCFDLVAGLTAAAVASPQAMTYADQTERDYQLLVEAVDSGQVVAAKGI